MGIRLGRIVPIANGFSSLRGIGDGGDGMYILGMAVSDYRRLMPKRKLCAWLGNLARRDACYNRGHYYNFK